MRRTGVLLTALAACSVALAGAVAGPAAADGGPVGGLLLGTTRVVVTPGATPTPKVGAAAWMVADATTGTVLAAKDPHGRFMPASTLKTLTALTVLPLLDKAASYVGRDQDTSVEGTRVGIVAGQSYTVDQLFYGLFLASGNDAASALANAAGGWPATVRRMNAEAHALQADDTHAVNPSGLDAKGQFTSVYDLALFARVGLARPDFRVYAATHVFAFPGVKKRGASGLRPTFQIQNQNRLLMDGYRGIVGVKTGYTTMAGRTYVGAAERDGHLILVTMMRIDGPTEDAGRKLLDWGFANVGKPGVGQLVPPLSEIAPSTGPRVSPVAAGIGAHVGSRPSSLPAVLFGGTGAAALVLLGAVGVGSIRRRRESRSQAIRLTATARRNTRL
jgi:D-alanyl-D-alanine carboxypeptidase (penicillin-binding protein 5/6)